MRTYYLVTKDQSEVISIVQEFEMESALIYFSTIKRLSIPDLLTIFDVVDKVD
jgi:hypothetical protein